jgi:hypothetical protein
LHGRIQAHPVPDAGAAVRDNLETLYGAVDEGALPFALPRFVRKELEGYLDCGLLRDVRGVP